MHKGKHRTVSDTLITTIISIDFLLPSVTSWLKPDVNPFTNDFKWANSNARQISSSDFCSNGSKLIRSVPENKTGSTGMIDTTHEYRFIYKHFDKRRRKMSILLTEQIKMNVEKKKIFIDLVPCGMIVKR